MKRTAKRSLVWWGRRFGPALPEWAANRLARSGALGKLLDPIVLSPQAVPVHVRDAPWPVLANPYTFTHRLPFWCGRLYESHTTDFLRRALREGVAFADIGMNYGHFTTVAAGILGPRAHIVAFEPNPRLCEIVRAHLDTFGVEGVTIVNLGLGSEAGEFRLMVGVDPGSAFIDQLADRGEEEDPTSTDSDGSVRVQVGVAADEIDQRIPSGDMVLKLDVEGAEVRVLEGMSPAVMDRVQSILVEVSPSWIGADGVGFIATFAESNQLESLVRGRLGWERVDVRSIGSQTDVVLTRCPHQFR